MFPRPLLPLLSLLLLPACHKGAEHPDTGAPPGDTSRDTGFADCSEDAAGELPEDVEWLVVDGASSTLFSMADQPFTHEYEGYYGTYDLNAEEIYGANGFKLERPGTVYGAAARWDNLPEDGHAAATLYAWPDFSSDGYAFDIWNPYGSYTRCLDAGDEGEWVTYVFPEPIRVDQPLHVFAGYHRDWIQPDEDGELHFTEPELLMENTYQEDEPFFAGVRWPEVDDQLYYDGMIAPWYTWQVRLAVVYDPEPDEDALPFHSVPDFRASSRVAWGDYDNDGDPDLMTNGPTLYRNDGGTFVDVTDEAIPGGTLNSSGGGVWGDYDNDGCLDYFGQGTGYGAGEVLLHNNCDGTFTDVWESSGIDDTQSERDCDGDGQPEYSPTEGAAWVDFDGDGFLDLYLAEYECSSDYDYFQNYDDRLFRNLGDGTFEDFSEQAGVETSNQAGRGVAPADFDLDGDVDIYVSNYRLDRNFLYVNQGDGTLDEQASATGTQGHWQDGAYGHSIGAVWGDIDNDGDFDLVVGNLAHPFFYGFSDRTMVLVNDGTGHFTDEGEERGIYYRETHSNPVLFDADNDGDLDLFITCVYTDRDSDFYENDGTGHFTLRNWESGLVVQNGWGAAAADYDGDGDVDLVAYELFENRLEAGSDGHHWLELRARFSGLHRDAYGAVVEVEAGGLRQLRLVSGGSGTSSQDDATLHVGLGDATVAERVVVHFPQPDGGTVTLEDVEADQRLWVYSDGCWAASTAPPATCEDGKER